MVNPTNHERYISVQYAYVGGNRQYCNGSLLVLSLLQQFDAFSLLRIQLEFCFCIVDSPSLLSPLISIFLWFVVSLHTQPESLWLARILVVSCVSQRSSNVYSRLWIQDSEKDVSLEKEKRRETEGERKSEWERNQDGEKQQWESVRVDSKKRKRERGQAFSSARASRPKRQSHVSRPELL